MDRPFFFIRVEIARICVAHVYVIPGLGTKGLVIHALPMFSRIKAFSHLGFREINRSRAYVSVFLRIYYRRSTPWVCANGEDVGTSATYVYAHIIWRRSCKCTGRLLIVIAAVVAEWRQREVGAQSRNRMANLEFQNIPFDWHFASSCARILWCAKLKIPQMWAVMTAG